MKLKFKTTRKKLKHRGRDIYFKNGDIHEVDIKRGQRLLELFPDNFIDMTPKPLPKLKSTPPVSILIPQKEKPKHIKEYGEKVKHIEDFFNLHAGKDIHILGGGPSLDDLPDDFFDDKISIAQSWSFYAFPNCTYYWSACNDLPTWVKKNRPNDFHKFIIGYSSNIAFNKARHWNQLGQWGNDVFCYANCTPARLVKNLDEVKSVMASILAGKRTEFCDRGTGIHMASQAAITFGAKRIYYHGCEAKTSKTHWHAQKRGLDKFYIDKVKVYPEKWQTGQTAMFKLDKQGLIWFAQALKGKIEFIKYWHNKGEEVIN